MIIDPVRPAAPVTTTCATMPSWSHKTSTDNLLGCRRPHRQSTDSGPPCAASTTYAAERRCVLRLTRNGVAQSLHEPALIWLIDVNELSRCLWLRLATTRRRVA